MHAPTSSPHVSPQERSRPHLQVLKVVHPHHPDRGGAADGLDDGREAYRIGRRRQLAGRGDEEVAGRGQARRRQHLARGVLVPRRVHRARRVAGQAQPLRQARHQRHGHLTEGQHTVQLPRILQARGTGRKGQG